MLFSNSFTFLRKNPPEIGGFFIFQDYTGGTKSVAASHSDDYFAGQVQEFSRVIVSVRDMVISLGNQ